MNGTLFKSVDKDGIFCNLHIFDKVNKHVVVHMNQITVFT